ncbi:ABC transporter ATP-binding protein [Streptomyces sp. NBC_00525]|uniref:ABC transporter ATP-binding protein n=1 Tax=Streptomyces sp. NBC_00525 TaxID=2903660 RepID=UPI002E7FB4BA|nr:ABC transporter ATP-binding protein [Streptomyces sp. NBC_00525]WUC96716.1 ABC transporter ATP-binding protein/permease [Streptomyces sp. NBC_00525]
MPGPPSFAGAVAVVRRRAGRWIDLARLLPRAGTPLVAASLLVNTVLGLLPGGFMLAASVLLDRVAGGSGLTGEVYGWLAVVVGAFALQHTLTPFQPALTEAVSRRVDGHCIGRLLDVTLRRAPFGVLEDSAHEDLLADARAAFARTVPTPGEAAAALPLLYSRYLQLTFAVALVGYAAGPAGAVITACTALAIRFGVRGTLGRYAALWDSLAGNRRRTGYIRQLATGTGAAKEIRLLGLMPWLGARFGRDTMEHLRPLWAGSRRLQFWPFIALAAAGFAGGTAVFALLAHGTVQGRTDLLALGIGLQAALVTMRFGIAFPECDTQTQFGLVSFHALERLEALEESKPRPAAGTEPAPRPAHSIRFEDVAFSYRPDAPPVLNGLDLEIPVGSCTAIVGLNGAGKTTLVKLLARLYDPTSGRITVDGADLAAHSPESWQRRIAVVFQDFLRYELPAADNIGFGAPHLAADEALLLDAARRAGAGPVVGKLPDGLRTPLSRRYEGGHDLSGGQWQRIALARALFAVEGGASLLVLDEPTAQLDVRGEVAFFDEFLAEAGSRGITSLIISHRFSTVRHADRIVVVEHGRVLEQGDHDSLMRADGRYAELFRLQAQRFEDDNDTVGSRS